MNCSVAAGPRCELSSLRAWESRHPRERDTGGAARAPARKGPKDDVQRERRRLRPLDLEADR